MAFKEKVWQEVPIKFLFSMRTGGAWGKEPISIEDSTVCIRAADFLTHELRHSVTDLTRRKFDAYEFQSRHLRKGDLIIEKSGGGEKQPVGRVISFDLDEPALCSNFLELLRPRLSYLYPRFGAYMFYSLWASRFVVPYIKQTTGIQNLDTEEYLSQSVRVPYLIQQRNIADYLDRETQKIDALIAAKKRLLELLAEKRRALITQAVTRGLDADAPMKDSGIEWLGKIPEHWRVEFAKWLFKEIDERSVDGREELLTVSHLTGVTPRSEKDVNMFMAETMEGYKICSSGDLVINTLWAWMGAMGVAFHDGIVSPAYNVYRPLGNYLDRYIDYLVRIPIFAQEVTRYSRGVWSSRLRLYPEEFFQVLLPLPPMEEQRKIVGYLDEQTDKIDRLFKNADRTISLLQERRTSLISAAVTGQLLIPD